MEKSFEKIIDQHLSRREGAEKKDLDLEKMEQVAQDKLGHLFSNEFKTFALRFVNIGEYQKILETGKFEGEIYVYGEKGDMQDTTFKKWFEGNVNERNKKNRGFASLARQHTHWDYTSDPLSYRDQIAGLVEGKAKENRLKEVAQELAHNENIPVIKYAGHFYNPEEKAELEKELLENVSIETLEKGKKLWQENGEFHRLNFLSGFDSFWSELVGIRLDNSKVWSRETLKELRDKLPVRDSAERYFGLYNMELRFGEANLKIVQEFIQNPEEYISSPGNRRKLYHAILYSPVEKGDQSWKPYQILLIFDDKEFDFKPQGSFMSYKEWAEFPHLKSDENYYKGLMGAVSLMPNKEMIEKMQELEKTSIDENLAHPIFDSLGKTKWPTEIQLNKRS